MRRLAVLALVLSTASAAEAAPIQMFRISGETRDGGSFAGWLVNDKAATDRCAVPGQGCFLFSRGGIKGQNPFGPYGMPFELWGQVLSYRILEEGDARTIMFQFDGRSGRNQWGGHNEVDMHVTYEYLSSRATDRTWNGDLSALGALLDSGFYGDYLTEGYNSAVTRFDIQPAPVPLPATLPLAAVGLSGLAAFGLRKRKRG